MAADISEINFDEILQQAFSAAGTPAPQAAPEGEAVNFDAVLQQAFSQTTPAAPAAPVAPSQDVQALGQQPQAVPPEAEVDFDALLKQAVDSSTQDDVFKSGTISTAPTFLEQTIGKGKRLIRQAAAGQQVGIQELTEAGTGKPQPFSDFQLEILDKAGDPLGIVENTVRFGGEIVGGTIPGVSGLLDDMIKINLPFMKSTAAFNKLRNFTQKVGRSGSESIKEGLASAMSFFSGGDKTSAKRLIERGNKAWRKEYLNPKELSGVNRAKAQKSISKAFGQVQQEFDDTVTPFLDDTTQRVNVAGMKQNFLNDLQQKGLIEVKKTTKTKAPKVPIFDEAGDIINLEKVQDVSIVAGENLTDETVKKNFLNAVDNLTSVMGEFKDDISAKQGHQLRKRLDSIRFGSDFGKVAGASSTYGDTRKVIVDQMPEAYKNVNSRFAKIFDIKDEFLLEGKFRPSRVESTLLNLGNKGKTDLREGIQELDNFLNPKDKFLENVLDELAVKQFGPLTSSGLTGKLIEAGVLGAVVFGRDVSPALAPLVLATSPRLQSFAARKLAGPAGRVAAAAPRTAADLIRAFPQLATRATGLAALEATRRPITSEEQQFQLRESGR
jgi:hypothetical protein